jgi:hypothetical protein
VTWSISITGTRSLEWPPGWTVAFVTADVRVSVSGVRPSSAGSPSDDAHDYLRGYRARPQPIPSSIVAPAMESLVKIVSGCAFAWPAACSVRPVRVRESLNLIAAWSSLSPTGSVKGRIEKQSGLRQPPE